MSGRMKVELTLEEVDRFEKQLMKEVARLIATQTYKRCGEQLDNMITANIEGLSTMIRKATADRVEAVVGEWLSFQRQE